MTFYLIYVKVQLNDKLMLNLRKSHIACIFITNNQK